MESALSTKHSTSAGNNSNHEENGNGDKNSNNISSKATLSTEPEADEENGRVSDCSDIIVSEELGLGAGTDEVPPEDSHVSPLCRSWTNKALPGDENFDDTNVDAAQVIQEWANGTSINGVAGIFDFVTWQLWKRLMWAFLVCTCAAIMIWQIAELIRQYQEYEVNTNTAIVVPASLEFPEVTICNRNLFSQSRMDEFNISRPRNEEELVQISQTEFSFLWAASFNNRNLEVSESWNPRITHAGRCWSFYTNETVLRPGAFNSGLYVSLFLNQQDFHAGETDDAGVLVWIQKPGTQINDQLPFFIAPPGRSTIAQMQMANITRITENPWAYCSGNSPEYTQAQCRVGCLNNAIRQKCGCRSDYGDKEDPSMEYCTTSEQLACVDDFCLGEGVDTLRRCSHCHVPPCTETRYDVSISSTDFSLDFLQEVAVNLANLFVPNGTENLDDPLVELAVHQGLKQNFVRLYISFDSIQYTQVTESKSFTLASLLGNIGGSMGLFLGISVLSIYELFGDLLGFRLFPRLFGYRHLHGVGARNLS